MLTSEPSSLIRGRMLSRMPVGRYLKSKAGEHLGLAVADERADLERPLPDEVAVEHAPPVDVVVLEVERVGLAVRVRRAEAPEDRPGVELPFDAEILQPVLADLQHHALDEDLPRGAIDEIVEEAADAAELLGQCRVEQHQQLHHGRGDGVGRQRVRDVGREGDAELAAGDRPFADEPDVLAIRIRHHDDVRELAELDRLRHRRRLVDRRQAEPAEHLDGARRVDVAELDDLRLEVVHGEIAAHLLQRADHLLDDGGERLEIRIRDDRLLRLPRDAEQPELRRERQEPAVADADDALPVLRLAHEQTAVGHALRQRGQIVAQILAGLGVPVGAQVQRETLRHLRDLGRPQLGEAHEPDGVRRNERRQGPHLAHRDELLLRRGRVRHVGRSHQRGETAVDRDALGAHLDRVERCRHLVQLDRILRLEEQPLADARALHHHGRLRA
jgi:hypothetical protein